MRPKRTSNRNRTVFGRTAKSCDRFELWLRYEVKLTERLQQITTALFLDALEDRLPRFYLVKPIMPVFLESFLDFCWKTPQGHAIRWIEELPAAASRYFEDDARLGEVVG